MCRNILRSAEPQLAEHFSFESHSSSFAFISTNPGDIEDTDFVAGSRPRTWPDNKWLSRRIPADSGSTYEAQLRSLFVGTATAFPVVFLVGGIGSGKSTAIRHVAATMERENHKQNKIRLVIDFNAIQERPRDSGLTPFEKNPWSILVDKLTDELRRLARSRNLDCGADLIKFWQWSSETVNRSKFAPSLFATKLDSLSGFLVHPNDRQSQYCVMQARSAIVEAENLRDRA